MTSAVTPDLQAATWGRRILALFVDWVTCLAVVEGLVAAGVLAGNPNGLGTLALFVLESALFEQRADGIVPLGFARTALGRLAAQAGEMHAAQVIC